MPATLKGERERSNHFILPPARDEVESQQWDQIVRSNSGNHDRISEITIGKFLIYETTRTREVND